MNISIRVMPGVTVALALSILAAPVSSNAQWNANDSVPVSMDGQEIELTMIGDGGGGSFMAWAKNLSGIGWRIYAQHADSAGQILWQPDGVQISAGSGYQPQLVLDGSGGVLVIWRDWGVRAMRVDASGIAVWSSEVEIVSNDDYPTYAPAYTSDGAGGAFITWDGPDYFTGDRDLFDIRAQRIDSGGQLPWGPVPVLVCAAPNYQSGAQALSDGQGGAIFAWRHEGNSADADIFAQRLDAAGNLLWDIGGEAVCTAVGVQEDPALHTDGAGGAIAVWKDSRATTSAIYSQRLNTLGQTSWSADGEMIGSVGNTHIDFRSVADLQGGAIIAWVGDSSSNGPRTAQRVDGNGTHLWSPGGVVIVDEDQNPTRPHIAADGNGGAFFAWSDRRRLDCWDSYAQHLDGTGNLLWDPAGVIVAAIEQSTVPRGVAALDSTEALVLWGGPDMEVGLPKSLSAYSEPTLLHTETSPASVVLSRVNSTGTGLVADCDPVVATPPLPASMTIASHPNPFNPRALITYVLPVDGHARLVVYNVAGRVVRTLLNDWTSAGSRESLWDGRDNRGNRVPSGVYLASLTVAEHEMTHRMLLLK
jgi:hypothetical protein